MLENLSKTIESISKIEVSAERKAILQSLVDYIQNKVNLNEEIRLNFICTHNSRRSHLSQIWAQTLAFQFGIKNVFCYSGGTEATTMFPSFDICNAAQPPFAPVIVTDVNAVSPNFHFFNPVAVAIQT